MKPLISALAGACALLFLAVPAAHAAPFRLCMDFSLFADGTPFPATFTMGSFRFSDGNLFANQTKGIVGLQFEKTGLRIRFPVPTHRVEMRLGTFASPVQITAFNAAGAAVGNTTLAKTNSYNNVQLSTADATSVFLANGGNEASLVKVCIMVDVRAAPKPE